MYWIHKYDIAQQYGGPEEGGWWYDAGEPVHTKLNYLPIPLAEWAFALARYLNKKEYLRREQLTYKYTNVLSYRETFYEWAVDESPKHEPFPAYRPHYE